MMYVTGLFAVVFFVLAVCMEYSKKSWDNEDKTACCFLAFIALAAITAYLVASNGEATQ